MQRSRCYKTALKTKGGHGKRNNLEALVNGKHVITKLDLVEGKHFKERDLGKEETIYVL